MSSIADGFGFFGPQIEESVRSLDENTIAFNAAVSAAASSSATSNNYNGQAAALESQGNRLAEQADQTNDPELQEQSADLIDRASDARHLGSLSFEDAQRWRNEATNYQAAVEEDQTNLAGFMAGDLMVSNFANTVFQDAVTRTREIFKEAERELKE